MLDDKTVFWFGRRKRDIKNKFGYFCRHCGQYKHQFVEWCNDEYHCPICTRKYDYMDAAEFEARVAVELAKDVSWYFHDENCSQQVSPEENIYLRLKSARLSVEAEMEE